MRNKNGFIAISIIFSFFVVFLMLLTINITNFAQNRILMNSIKKDIKKDLNIKPLGKKCRRATVLHSEDCPYESEEEFCSGAGYTAGGEKGQILIEYGRLGSGETLISGDAFDCDVNGDGIYDATTERFYYVSDKYTSGTTGYEIYDSNIAVLIYYNNVSGGIPNNTTKYKYHASNYNYQGPITAVEQLPTTIQWNNVKLSNEKRTIKNETGGSSYSSYTYPNYDYKNKAARLLTVQELKKATNKPIPGAGYYGIGSSKDYDSYNYLLENTKFSNNGSLEGYWLETPCVNYQQLNNVWYIYGNYRHVSHINASDNSCCGVRPVIEVTKSDIEY